MRFQVTDSDITAISVGDESHAVVDGIVEVPNTDEARAALQPLLARGVLIGLPDDEPTDDKKAGKKSK